MPRARARAPHAAGWDCRIKLAQGTWNAERRLSFRQQPSWLNHVHLIKIQVFALVLSYQGCASFEWVDLPKIVEPPQDPVVSSTQN